MYEDDDGNPIEFPAIDYDEAEHRDVGSGLATKALAEALVQAHFQACGGLGGIHTSSDSAAFGIGEGGSNLDARRASLRQMRRVLYSRSLLNILSYSHSKNYTTTTIEPNVQKFITHLKDVGHASMEDVEVEDILAQLRDVENHRVELLRRALVQTQTPLSHPNQLVSTLRPIGLNPQPSDQLVCSDEFYSYRGGSGHDNGTPVLPCHSVSYLVTAHDRAHESLNKGGRKGKVNLSHGAMLCARTGANAFFRKLNVKSKWQYSSNQQTHGSGSPFLSEEVLDLLSAVRRREIQTGSYVKHKSVPWLSRDFTMFDIKCLTKEASAFDALSTTLKDLPPAADTPVAGLHPEMGLVRTRAKAKGQSTCW